ncbi:hypothetical protein [Cupriavidus pauculus]|uniref:hypothetical protein n=1 Tax=Cupriavidus pauculus TaxID=82633 RepID=UPI0007862B59|nr:hypothetical protein [Cupriavidus pauculus]
MLLVSSAKKENTMDFVSLKEAVLALAGRVPVPGSITNRAKFNEAHQIAAYREELYRLSCSAADLEQALTNTKLVERPRWLDKRNPMRRPRVVEVAEIDGMRQLQEWANLFVEWDSEYQSNRWYGQWKPELIIPAEYKLFNVSNLQRVQGIGFDRSELVSFLNRMRLLHSVGEVFDPKPNETVSDAQCTGEAIAAKLAAETGKRPRRQFRGPLAHVLRRAVDLASDPDDHLAVWEALIDLAKLPARPLIGYTGDSIKWVNEQEDIEFLTKVNLKKRISRRR